MTNYYKIVCICQVYNESTKGNLLRFFSNITNVVDEVVIYDDGSVDDTADVCARYTEHVIKGKKNEFSNEVQHKQALLNYALGLSPDFILWLDADEVLTNEASNQVQELCKYCIENNIDGVFLNEINLWNSSAWERLDSMFGGAWFCRLWKVKKGLHFKISQGLHARQYPIGLDCIIKNNINELAVLHYGFGDFNNLAAKYFTYRFHNQRGYFGIDRILYSKELCTRKVLKHLFPDNLVCLEDKPINLSFADSLNAVHDKKILYYNQKIMQTELNFCKNSSKVDYVNDLPLLNNFKDIIDSLGGHIDVFGNIVGVVFVDNNRNFFNLVKFLFGLSKKKYYILLLDGHQKRGFWIDVLASSVDLILVDNTDTLIEFDDFNVDFYKKDYYLKIILKYHTTDFNVRSRMLVIINNYLNLLIKYVYKDYYYEIIVNKVISPKRLFRVSLKNIIIFFVGEDFYMKLRSIFKNI